MIVAIDLDCIFAKYYDMLAGELQLTVFPTSSTISILHQVPEGHVGVYWRGGALLKTITDPGDLPLVTHFEPVQVTLQTDEVTLVIHVWKIEDSVFPFIIVLKASVSNIVGKGCSMWYKRGCHDQF
ncbi:hypothetical protein TB2_021473 [Malus domestica]